MVNASDTPDEQKKLELNKKDLICPVIVLVVESPVSQSEFNKVCDYDNYSYLLQQYRNIINSSVCDYEFHAEIIGDYLSKRNQASNHNHFMYDRSAKTS
jgi:hypothetical protein